MGHPHLYHTSEQQQIANRAKSHRHYQSKPSSEQRYVSFSSFQQPLYSNYYSRNPPYWCRRVAQPSPKFNTLINTHPTEYVDTLLATYYASSGNKDLLGNAVQTFSRYQKSIQQYKDEILQLGGVDLEWHEANELSKQVCKVVHWIEEIFCLAMVDPKGLIASHAMKQLMYQVV
ncbi:hypothetical protein L208DRAFT_1316505 [Tricholoma matsutake]|nr:hypothetical protein L208DRAFT_1316505 [Tricholoma matsutake 945]